MIFGAELKSLCVSLNASFDFASLKINLLNYYSETYGFQDTFYHSKTVKSVLADYPLFTHSKLQ